MTCFHSLWEFVSTAQTCSIPGGLTLRPFLKPFQTLLPTADPPPAPPGVWHRQRHWAWEEAGELEEGRLVVAEGWAASEASPREGGVPAWLKGMLDVLT